MSLDVVLMIVVLGGIGLSAAYVRAEYLRWRDLGAAERRRETVFRKLHAARLFAQRDKALLPRVLKLQEFSEAEAANPDHVSPVADRRKRRRV
ncbi:MAG TPA: hypothetical protein VK794_13340 [Steroidobacteraceae bacterium]|jgi:hypothetical protein|nr:hypothetical protein [Steroidobacteraceae bacterium]